MHLFFFMVYLKKKVSGKEYCSWEVLYIFLPLNVSLPNQRPNKMKLSPFLLFQLLYISTATEPEREVVDFKIVEGLPKPKTTYTSSSTPIKPTPSREPNGVPQNTPIEFSALDGKCFSERIGKYMYEVCPFRNVTQLDKQSTWNPYYGILGIFESWSNNASFVKQRYTDGTPCGSINREVTITLQCADKYGISNVEEPKTCVYELDFQMPDVCNMNATLDEGTREAGEEAGVVNAEMGGVEETVTEKVADSNQAEQTVKEVEVGVAALDDSPVLDIRNDAPSSEDMERVGGYFEEADRNKDGSLSAEEFEGWVSSYRLLKLTTPSVVRAGQQV